MTLYIKLILSFSFVFLAIIAFGQESTLSDQKVKDEFESFAYYLADLELYEMAAEEMEKSIFYNGENSEKLVSLFHFYKQAGQSHKIVDRMNTVLIKDEKLISNYIQSLIVGGYHREASSGIEAYRNLISETSVAKYEYEIALLERNWKKAVMTFETMDPLSKGYYRVFNNKIPPSPRKSKTKAMIFSSILPTSGRFYAKDYKDALISLAFISGPAYQSYRRFDRRGIRSAGGWIYGGVAFGFYLGNIYGSGQSAKIYNLKKDEALIHEALDLINTGYK